MIIPHVALIHIWMYISNKKEGTFKLLRPDNFFKGSDKYKEIYEDILHWEKPYIIRGRKAPEVFLKLIYLASWLTIGLLTSYCVDKLGYFQFSTVFRRFGNTQALTLGCPTVCEVLFITDLALNYFSCFSSFAFCYFIRELSNEHENLDCRLRQPSSTTEFQELYYLSSRVSISFFMVSALYIWLLLACIAFGGPISQENAVYFCLLLLCVILPCVVSLILVFLLPKVFLNRLLRRWKREKAKELDKKEKETTAPDELRLIQSDREHLWNDKLKLMKTEIIIGFFALAVDIASLVICLLQFLGD